MSGPSRPRRPCLRPGCPELQPCPVHVRRQQPASRLRREREPGKRWYDLQRWRRERRAFLRLHPRCVHCEEKGRLTLSTEVDHITPHRGDWQRFWAQSNWQALCDTCHGAKSRQDQLEGRS